MTDDDDGAALHGPCRELVEQVALSDPRLAANQQKTSVTALDSVEGELDP
jgi:hypothetical protein